MAFENQIKPDPKQTPQTDTRFKNQIGEILIIFTNPKMLQTNPDLAIKLKKKQAEPVFLATIVNRNRCGR